MRAEEHFERLQTRADHRRPPHRGRRQYRQAAEAAAAAKRVRKAVGLLRTEFLFLERNTPPTETSSSRLQRE